MEAKIDAILARMSVEEKVGQALQPEFRSITPEDVRRYPHGVDRERRRLGAGREQARLGAGLAELVESYYDASVDPSNPGRASR